MKHRLDGGHEGEGEGGGRFTGKEEEGRGASG